MPGSCGVGVDVAKDTLDVAWSTEPDVRWRTTNDERGWAALIERCRGLQPSVIVLEATGGYETGVASALSVAGLPVAVVNPRHVRAFATALGDWKKPTPWMPAYLPVCHPNRTRAAAHRR